MSVRMNTTYLSQNIANISDRNFTTLDEDNTIEQAVKVMRDKDTSSILVINKHSGEPVGMVTERDILHRVLAESKDPSQTTLKSIMSFPLISVNDGVSVREAITLMRNKHIRRLPVTKMRNIIGLTTLKSTIGNIPSQGIELAEVELPEYIVGKQREIICPYCQSRFEDKNKIGEHIDTLHILNC